jgi:hypothetical protein
MKINQEHHQAKIANLKYSEFTDLGERGLQGQDR